MLRPLALALLMLSPAASRAQAWDCLPDPVDVFSVRKASTPFGVAYAWWCQVPSTTPDMERWRPNYMLVPHKYRDLSKFAAAAERVALSSDRLATARAELEAVRVVPPAGSVEEYDFRLLRHTACLEIAKQPWPATFEPPLPADWCGPAPTLPVVAEVWRVAKAPVTANPPGTRPLYHYVGGVMVNAQQRIAEFTPCNPDIARLKLDLVTYCVPAGATNVYAVASKL